MDRLVMVLGGLLTVTAWGGVSFTAVWAGLSPLLLFGAAGWPGFLEAHLAVGALGLACGAAAIPLLVIALPLAWWDARRSTRPSVPPSSSTSTSA